MKRLFIEPLDVLMFRSERPFIARESHVAKIGTISPLTFEGALKSKIFIEFAQEKNYSASDFQRRRKRDETEEDVRRTLEELIVKVKDKMEKDKELVKLFKLIGYPINAVECNVNTLLEVMRNPPLNYPSKLRVLGVFFAEKEKKIEHFPIPNDIVREDKNGGEVVKLRPSKIELDPDLNLSATFSSYSKVSPIKGLIELDELRKYLHGKVPKIKRIKLRKNKESSNPYPYFIEIRTGIQLQRKTKQTVEGALYTAEFLRLFENWGFVVWYELKEIEHEEIYEYLKGIVKIGGEGRGAYIERIDDLNLNEKLYFPELIKEINKEGKFKFYLAAPSCFGNNAWKPPEEELKQKLGVDSLKLIAALPGKPVYIGGYDFALNVEKPLRRWVNSGAVYYYRFEGKIKDDLTLPIKIVKENVDMRCAFIGRW